MQHNQTKVGLSKYELDLVTNAQILLTKNEIIKKVYDLFGLLADDFVSIAKKTLPQEIITVAPKIARGENYEGLPYVMLDYPRVFNKQDTFAIRTFFWWGNFFSITLQISGHYLHKLEPLLQNAIANGKLSAWYIGISESEWNHHFRSDNYAQVSRSTSLASKPFIKLATKIPLQEWDNAKLFLKENFYLITNLLA